MSNSLLNFEQSITDELSAELLIGRDINLERARLAALNGDYAGAAKEIFKTIGGINEFSKMNVIQQEALAKAAGLTVDQLSDAFIQQKFQGTETGKQIERLRKQGLVEEANLLAAGKLTGDNLREAMDQVSAGEKFAIAVKRAKEIFSDLVSGGTLQSIADALTGIANSTIFQYFGSDAREQRIQSGMDSLEKRVVSGTATASEKAKYKEMQALKEEQFWCRRSCFISRRWSCCGCTYRISFWWSRSNTRFCYRRFNRSFRGWSKYSCPRSTRK